MPHPRQLLRDAAIAALLNQTTAGPRVDNTRTEPRKRAQLPAISVYTQHETVTDDSKDLRPRELWRDLRLEIVCWVAHSNAYPAVNALDDMATQIEAVMNLDPYLGGTAGVHGVILDETEIDIDDDPQRADPLIGVIRLTYTASYTSDPAVIGADADYLRTNAVTQIAGAGADNTVSDLINQRP
jgi:hypothetical protein